MVSWKANVTYCFLLRNPEPLKWRIYLNCAPEEHWMRNIGMHLALIKVSINIGALSSNQ